MNELLSQGTQCDDHPKTEKQIFRDLITDLILFVFNDTQLKPKSKIALWLPTLHYKLTFPTGFILYPCATKGNFAAFNKFTKLQILK